MLESLLILVGDIFFAGLDFIWFKKALDVSFRNKEDQ